MRLVFDFESWFEDGQPENLVDYWKPAEILEVHAYGTCDVLFQNQTQISPGHIYAATREWHTVELDLTTQHNCWGHFTCTCGFTESRWADRALREHAEHHIRQNHMHGEIRYKELYFFV